MEIWFIWYRTQSEPDPVTRKNLTTVNCYASFSVSVIFESAFASCSCRGFFQVIDSEPGRQIPMRLKHHLSAKSGIYWRLRSVAVWVFGALKAPLVTFSLKLMSKQFPMDDFHFWCLVWWPGLNYPGWETLATATIISAVILIPAIEAPSVLLLYLPFFHMLRAWAAPIIQPKLNLRSRWIWRCHSKVK